MELVILSCAPNDLRLQRREGKKLLPGIQIIPIDGSFMWFCDDGWGWKGGGNTIPSRKAGRGSAAHVLAVVKAYLEEMS